MPIKDRRARLALLQVLSFTIAVLTTLTVQIVFKFAYPTPPPLQSATNHYLLALEQVPGLMPNRLSPFLSSDPFQPKPKMEHRLLLKENLELAKLLAVKAFLWGVIYYSEGTYSNFNTVSPYRLILGEAAFQSYADHPRQLITVNPGSSLEVSSDAAGACQFTSEIWDALHQHYPHVWYTDLPAFHPQNQDIGCLLLFAEAGGYQRLVDGVSVNQLGEIVVDVKQFMAAVAISCPIWASFPCEDGAGRYTTPEFGYQSAKPIEDLWRNYRTVLEAEQSLLSLVPFK
jgi:muramidase (phage lysozyme)